MTNQIGGGFRGTASIGTKARQPPELHFESHDPTIYNSQNYSEGDFWLNISNKNLWYLASLAGTMQSKGLIADWVLLSNATGTVLSLTSNTGGAVFPLVGNINVVGDSVGITGVGNPATNTITLSLVGGGAAVTGLKADDGLTATPLAGIINALTAASAGNTTDNLISDAATANTVTFRLKNSINQPNTVDINTGVYLLGSNRFIHNFGSTNNVFVGRNSGNFTLSGSSNICVGPVTGAALTTGNSNVMSGTAAGTSTTTGLENVYVGTSAGQMGTSASTNCAIGQGALLNNLSGNNNTAVGNTSLQLLVSGSNNTALGYDSGTNYLTTESSNIVIRSTGTTLDANTIRIGTQGNGAGQQNATYIAGIYNAAVGATNTIVYADNTGKLGTSGAVTGTFTPVLRFGGASTGITYSTRTGYYNVVGNVVFIAIFIVLSSKGSSTGLATVSGIPITSAAAPLIQKLPMFGTTVGPTMTAGNTVYQANIAASTAILDLQDYGSVSNNNLTDTEFANNTSFLVQGFYFSA